MKKVSSSKSAVRRAVFPSPSINVTEYSRLCFRSVNRNSCSVTAPGLLIVRLVPSSRSSNRLTLASLVVHLAIASPERSNSNHGPASGFQASVAGAAVGKRSARARYCLAICSAESDRR